VVPTQTQNDGYVVFIRTKRTMNTHLILHT